MLSAFCITAHLNTQNGSNEAGTAIICSLELGKLSSVRFSNLSLMGFELTPRLSCSPPWPMVDDAWKALALKLWVYQHSVQIYPVSRHWDLGQLCSERGQWASCSPAARSSPVEAEMSLCQPDGVAWCQAALCTPVTGPATRAARCPWGLPPAVTYCSSMCT